MLGAKLAVVVAFGLAAVVCAVTAVRVRRLADRELRRGLTAVFVLTAVWSTMEAVRLFSPVDRTIAHAGYLGGLVVGLAAVGAWLYFCSAYAGLDYHHSRRWLTAGAVAYLAAVAVKLTNPLHGRYYTARLRQEPFTYFGVDPGPAHWVVVAGVYVLVGGGFVALFAAFRRARADTTGLWVLSVGAALPVLPAVTAALTSGTLPGLNYEPLGVALFGVGALFVVEDRFLAVAALARQQVVDDIESAVLVVDRDERLLDFNDAAASLFPGVTGGRPVGACSPALQRRLRAHRGTIGEGPADGVTTDGGVTDERTADGETTEGTARQRDDSRTVSDPESPRQRNDERTMDDLEDGSLLTVNHGDGPRHYLCHVVDVELGCQELGWGLVLSEVTELEEKRRALRRQNEQLDDFAAGISHELRNPLSVVLGYADLLEEATDGEVDHDTVDRAVREITDATSRMSTAVDEMNMLARRGRTVQDPTPNRVSETLRAARENVDAAVEATVDSDGLVVSDGTRLCQILQNVLAFADTEGASRARVDVRERSVLVELDGTVDVDETRRLLRHGYASSGGDTRLALANARTMARAHGWSVSVERAGSDTLGGIVFVFEHVDATPDAERTREHPGAGEGDGEPVPDPSHGP